MASFAKQQLEKYGWSEGKGLGKNENGRVKPIKPALKFDNHGIGHDESKIWTNKWWSTVFNDASSRISVTKNETGVKVECEKKSVESTLPVDSVYKNFIKSGTFEENEGSNITPALEERNILSMSKGSQMKSSTINMMKIRKKEKGVKNTKSKISKNRKVRKVNS